MILRASYPRPPRHRRLPHRSLLLAAYLGHAGARRELGPEAPPDGRRLDLLNLLGGLGDWEPQVLQRAALAVTGKALAEVCARNPFLESGLRALRRAVRRRAGRWLAWSFHLESWLAEERHGAGGLLRATRRAVALRGDDLATVEERVRRVYRVTRRASGWLTPDELLAALREDLLAWALGAWDPLS